MRDSVGRWLAAALIACLAGCASDSAPPPAPEPCAAALCRQPRPIELRLSDGRQFTTTLQTPMPIVSGPYVTVFPGEQVWVEATQDGDRLTRLTAVDTVTHPERTLSFELGQMAGKVDMMLVVKSPFAQPVKYRLAMMLPTSDALRETSSCPVVARGAAYEHWPHPILHLVATDFRLIESSSPEMKCD